MNKCYDFAENRLVIETFTGVVFDLEMRGFKTVVSGTSSTGKSYLCSTILDYKKAQESGVDIGYDVSSIFILNAENKQEWKSLSKFLIIVDRADIILNKDDLDFLNKDRKNKYLIFVRRPMKIYISPNYKGEFVVENNHITLHYNFNVKGWF